LFVYYVCGHRVTVLSMIRVVKYALVNRP